MRKIYITGLNVTAPEVHSLIQSYKDICAKYEYEALFPATVEQLERQNGKLFDTPLEEAEAVFQANLQRIDSASAVIANLDYFDGFYVSDTIFEIGYAYSRGKQIIGYFDHEYQAVYYALRDHIPEQFANGGFGRPSHLMVACATIVTIKGCLDCLDYIYNPKYDGEDEKCKLYIINHQA